VYGLTFPVVGSRIDGSIPKKGTVAAPGFVSIAPGNGVTTIDPVSVCLTKKKVRQKRKAWSPNDIPEGVYDGTLVFAHKFVVPIPSLRVDGLTNTPQHTQRA
jgi:hypothetical protein